MKKENKTNNFVYQKEDNRMLERFERKEKRKCWFWRGSISVVTACVIFGILLYARKQGYTTIEKGGLFKVLFVVVFTVIINIVSFVWYFLMLFVSYLKDSRIQKFKQNHL